MSMDESSSLEAYITKLGGGFTRSHRYFRIAARLRAEGFQGLMSELCREVSRETGRTQAAVEKGIARAAQDIWTCPDGKRLLKDLNRTCMDYPGPEELLDCIVQAWKLQGRGLSPRREKVLEKRSPYVVSKFYGIVIKIFPKAGDKQVAPHLHALYQGLLGVVSLERPEMLEGDLPPCALNLVLAWVERWQSELLEIWETENWKALPPLD